MSPVGLDGGALSDSSDTRLVIPFIKLHRERFVSWFLEYSDGQPTWTDDSLDVRRPTDPRHEFTERDVVTLETVASDMRGLLEVTDGLFNLEIAPLWTRIRGRIGATRGPCLDDLASRALEPTPCPPHVRSGKCHDKVASDRPDPPTLRDI